jgi:hypothetical protein
MMAEERNKEIEALLGVSSRTFEEHTQRISELLSKAQEKFDKDYTSFAATLGSALIVFGAALAWFEKSTGLAIVAVVTGAVIVIIALILRHLSGDKQVNNTQAMFALERERSQFARKSAVFQHLWLYGQPKNLSAEQMRFFLGDSTMPIHRDHSTTPPEQLPAPEIDD